MFAALAQRGIFQGLLIGTLRLLRCNPWGGSGYDPVEAFKWPWEPTRREDAKDAKEKAQG